MSLDQALISDSDEVSSTGIVTTDEKRMWELGCGSRSPSGQDDLTGCNSSGLGERIIVGDEASDDGGSGRERLGNDLRERRER